MSPVVRRIDRLGATTTGDVRLRLTVSGLSDDVRGFLSAHISSIEQLEVLLLLRREATRGWSGDEIARELRINPESARARLEDLHGRGLLVVEGAHGYRYAPRSGELDRAVAETARAYSDLRVTVINFIFSKPVDKIRTFADAFKLKGDS